MDILRGDVAHIDVENLGGDLHVLCHPGRSRQKGQLQPRIPVQRIRQIGLPCKGAHTPQPGTVHLLYLLDHFKQAGSAGNAICLQGRSHRQADGFLRAALVRHHQVRVQRIQSSVHAFHRSVKTFQINCNIDSHRITSNTCYSRTFLKKAPSGA